MKNKFKISWYFIEVLYTKLILFFGFSKSIKPIPKNTPYCYDVIDVNKEPIDGYRIKSCKYYRSINGEGIACTYVGFIGDDMCLWDQCKICDVE